MSYLNFKSLAEDCCGACPQGCEIPYNTLRLTWTNYDPLIHSEPSSFIADIYKMNWAQLAADSRDPTECVWTDRPDDLGSAEWILENPGFSILTDLLTLEEWYDDDPNDPVNDTYEMLGNQYHYADFTGDLDITITVID